MKYVSPQTEKRKQRQRKRRKQIMLCAALLCIVAVVRIMSVASLMAAVIYPIMVWMLAPAGVNRVWHLILAIVMSVLCMYCHRSNIMRLVRGEENRLDFGKINKISKKFMQMHKDKREQKK